MVVRSERVVMPACTPLGELEKLTFLSPALEISSNGGRTHLKTLSSVPAAAIPSVILHWIFLDSNTCSLS